MTQEEKELVLKDLSARLPYGVKIKCLGEILTLSVNWLRMFEYHLNEIKPYLRPMSSMTEEELKELREETGLIYDYENGLDLAEFPNNYKCLDFYLSEIPSYVVVLVFDWLNAHHFDYRGLIDRGLALEASEDMYKTE